MRSGATYALLVQRIASVMAVLPRAEAAELAGTLTAAVNAAIGGQSYEADTAQLRDLLPPATRTLASLTCPWEAYQRAHAPDAAALRLDVEPLCTLPAELRLAPTVRRLSSGTGLWSGSLMTCIHELINGAGQELVIIVPYWSLSGVRGLLRHLTRQHMNGVAVSVLTRAREELKESGQLAAVELLMATFTDRGAQVKVFCPPQVEGKRALVHGKLVIADSRRAYLGSANFSAGGIEASLEVGVRLEGLDVQTWAQWAHILKGLFEPWEDEAQPCQNRRIQPPRAVVACD